MAIFNHLQFYSPQSWVNRGVGGDLSVGFSGADDYFRPPGTFSFTSGLLPSFLLTHCLLLWLHLNI
jgi:hypothetical protein